MSLGERLAGRAIVDVTSEESRRLAEVAAQVWTSTQATHASRLLAELCTLAFELTLASVRARRAASIGELVSCLLLASPELDRRGTAAELGVSEGFLSRKIHGELGVTFVEHRAHTRVAHFLALSGDGRRNLLAAALDAGFGSYSQFHRIFTRLSGSRPRDYLDDGRQRRALLVTGDRGDQLAIDNAPLSSNLGGSCSTAAVRFLSLRAGGPMTRIKVCVWLAATAALVIPARPASAAEAITVAAAPESQWHVEAAAGYATADIFSGLGLSPHAGRVQAPYLMVGFAIESTKLHGEWTDQFTGDALSTGFRSTLFGGFFRSQLPTRFVTPYAELALGYAGIHSKDPGLGASACVFDGGVNGALAFGAAAHPIRSISVGLCGGLRLVSTSASCPAVDRSPSVPVIKSLAMTVAYHW